jgi:hypothetical protein
MKTPTAPKFAELYCRARGLPAGDFQRALFREALYPHARLVAGLVTWLNRRHFVADYEFVEDVGHIRSVGDFALPMGSYVEHPDNRRFLRRRLRLRTSARRMLRVVREILPGAGSAAVEPPAGTFEPFGPA